ncbi:MAG: Abi-alpha family protein [Cyclobacteriaceae bacterium]
MKSLVNKAFSYLDYLIKPSLEELGGILGDQVKVLRYQNQLRLVQKVKKKHRDRGISPRQIPLKTIASMLNHASYEEEPRLVDMWASLLANATDSDNQIDYHHVLSKILSEMSSHEALVMSSLAKRVTNNSGVSYFDRGTIVKLLDPDNSDQMDIKAKSSAQIVIDNFVRLGLISIRPPNTSGKARFFKHIQRSRYEFTMLGKTFIQECEIISNL